MKGKLTPRLHRIRRPWLGRWLGGIIGSLGLLATPSRAAEVPVYVLRDDAVPITAAAAARLPSATVLREPKLLDRRPERLSGGVGRSMFLCSSEELDRLVLALPADWPHRIGVEPEGMFVLWKAGESTCTLADDTVVVRFDLQAESSGTAYLAIGADHRFVVLANGRPLFARGGYTPHVEGSHLVALPVHAGVNAIAIVAVHPEVPSAIQYFAPPWEMSLRLFPTEAAALAFHDVQNVHCLDTPVVESPADLRCLSGFPLFREAKLYDAQGATINEGEVDGEGRIRWHHPLVAVRSAFVAIDGARGEPVLFSTADALNTCVNDPTAAGDLLAQARTGWAYRVRHLLKPEHEGMRKGDPLWARKLASAYQQAVLTPAQVAALDARIGGRRTFTLNAYTSGIDGTTQHFLSYLPVNRGQTLDNYPVIVVVPTVPSPERPFLESGVFAGTSELELWCRVADQYGCALLWAGYNDVDYGGPIAQAQLHEVVRHFYAQNSSAGPLYLLGLCSAGVSAIAYVRDHPDTVAGLLLYSPVLTRHQRRWTPGMWGDPIPIPFKPQAIDQLAGEFRVDRCSLIFDSAMPGHGEKKALPALFALCKRNEVPLEEFRVAASDEYVWGARQAFRIALFCRWIKAAEGNPSRPGFVAPVSSPARTVSEALLRGFRLGEADTALQPWLTWWESQLRIWRGEPWASSSPPELPTRIQLATLSQTAMAARISEAALGEIRESCSDLFLVARDPGSNDVIVARTPDASAPFPKVDILLDGLFEACLWGRVDQGWKILAKR